ncbi:MAG TPA: prenyltransferase [Candidatus Dormibacteraeota bacterium]
MLDFDAAETAAAIATVQRRDGSIPHHRGGPTDPWNHVEAAMALDAGRFSREAERAYLWLLSTQRADGSWPMRVSGDRVEDASADANFCAYIATGLWHHFLAAGDESLLEEAWPSLERAVEFVLGLQAPGGEVLWARDPAGRPWPGALLTSCSSIHASLGCALAVAAQLHYARPRWELALARLGEAIRTHPEAFEDKDRYAMDWYYPILGGALTGEPARRRLLARWDEFVLEGYGCRCVSDRPWVTAAETAELVIALEAAGLRAEAVELFGWIQRLRAADGSYWTGATVPDQVLWPRERPTWTSGAVVLAADALWGEGLTSGLFRGATALETVA